MQILILGNGFDLASGLPTSYADFFEWRLKQIIEKVDVSSVFEKYKQAFYLPRKKINMVGNVNVEELSLLEINIDGNKKNFFDLYIEIQMIISNLKIQKINFFDLYFMFNRECKENWNDIEREIEYIVNNISDYSRKDSKAELNKFFPETNSYRTDNKINDKTIYNFFLSMYFEEYYVEEKENVYELLLFELKKFEHEFKKYLSSVVDEAKGYQVFKDIYTYNYDLLTSNIEYGYIINFNYTSVTDVIEKNHMPKEINVHGKYDQVTIFGIDQKECKSVSNEFILTKTYRKIAENTTSLILPSKRKSTEETQELIFYGHSLAKADYSYFQSLFDLYDIYNQAFVTFKYSVYDEKKEEDIKKEVFLNVSNLITTYGMTMTNKDHGKNLLHKLLLEGRLKIEAVQLRKFDY